MISRRRLLLAVILAFFVGGTRAASAQQVPPPAPAHGEKHTALTHSEDPIPSLDSSKILQEYVNVAAPPAPMVAALAGPFTKARAASAAMAAIDSIMPNREYKTRSSSLIRVGGKWICTYNLEYSGIPLAKTSDVLCIMGSNGRVQTARKRNIPLEVNATKATVDGKAAASLGQADFTQRTKVEKPRASSPMLEIWVDAARVGQLCWTYIVSNDSLENPFAAQYWVSAVGEAKVLAIDNLIHHEHEGTVTGTAWETSPSQPTQKLPLGMLDVTRTGGGGGTRPTGMDGRYSFLPGAGSVTISGTLAGPYCTIENKGGGAVLTQSQAGSNSNPIDLNFSASAEFDVAQVRVRPETSCSCSCPPEADDRIGQMDEG